MLWPVLALMTAVAIFAVLWPLARTNAAERTAADAEVYKDQLDEIERDRASGVIGVAEADAARVEVSRRLLAAADAKPPPALDAATGLRHRRSAAVITLVFVPLAAISLYLLLGSPNLPGEPLAQRLTAPAGTDSMAGLIARVEAHLEQNPDDGRGWDVIAPVYMRLGRFDDAIRAFRASLRLNGENADRQANLGEALSGAANGVITSDAKAAFERALALDASNPRAQFYLGLAAEQDGRTSDAVERWRKLLAQAPADAPWVVYVRQALARLDPAAATSAAPGPSAQDVASAADMAPSDRDQMVRGMVERLAARLSADGSDVEGWLRLMRAYVVLGDRDKARAAAADARRALASDPDKLRRIDEGAKNFGLDG
ncbi:MAG: c-type cytochrome biogenesis protein CcmI [Xanthobacteraceae bacterium]|nr:c-type cytochrome biogenesis protein CcmI [Xanthobacteraceae bacterium]MBV9629351.1 c-type cytochrome biogenesis protein CcmI [Xanthobacteraceae bacterium]